MSKCVLGSCVYPNQTSDCRLHHWAALLSHRPVASSGVQLLPPTGHPEAPTQCSSTGSGPKQWSQRGSYIIGEKWYCFTGKAPTTLQALVSCAALGVTSHSSVTNTVRQDMWLDTGHHRKGCRSCEKFPTCITFSTLANTVAKFNLISIMTTNRSVSHVVSIVLCHSVVSVMWPGAVNTAL